MRADLSTIVFCLVILYSSGNAEDRRLIGCFKDSHVKSNKYYQVRQTMTWKMCIQVCDHRLTRYAAVQVYNSLNNRCFCGNNFEEHSSPVNSSDCNPCQDNADNSCGGENAVSIYWLRDSSPFAVFVAGGNNGVRMYNGTALTDNVLASSTIRIVDYLFSEDELIFIDGSSLLSSFYNYMMAKYNTREHKVGKDEMNLFTIDWVQKRIIYTDYKSIFAIGLYGRGPYVFSWPEFTINGLDYDPYYRYLFGFDSENNLFSYKVEGRKFYIYQSAKVLQVIKAITVDTNSQTIFAIGTLPENDLSLVSIDYEDIEIRIIYKGPYLSNPVTFDTFGGEVVWINHSDQDSMYRCNVTTCIPKNVISFYGPSNTGNITSIKIYHPERQTPSTKYLCGLMNCSHTCEKVSLFIAKCYCPPGMEIGQDKHTCQQKLHRKESSLVAYVSFPSVTQTLSHTTQGPEYYSNETFHPEFIPDESHNLKTKTLNDDKNLLTEKVKAISTMCRKTSFDILLTIFFIIIIVLLSVLICLIVCAIKYSRSFINKCKNGNMEHGKNESFSISNML